MLKDSNKDELLITTEKKNIKIKKLVYSALGGTVGGPIYVILGGTIYKAGAAVILSLILLGALLIFLIMNYSELSLSLPVLGGSYSFSKEAIGGIWGFIIGWLMLLGNITFCALSALGFGYSFAVFLPDRAIIEQNGFLIAIFGFLIIVIFSILNLRGKKLLGRVMTFFTFILVIGFVIYIITALFVGPFTNNENYNLENIVLTSGELNFVDMIKVIPILFGIFCLYEWSSSFESITTNMDKIKQSSQKIPRAFFLAIIIAVIIYVLVAASTLINMGEPYGDAWNLIGNSTNPLADTLHMVAGPIGAYFIGFAGMICTMTSMQASMQMSYRIYYAMGRDGYLPRLFTGTLKPSQKKNEVPKRAILINCMLILASVLLFRINLLVNISTFAIISSMGFLSFTVVLLRKRRPNLARPYKVIFYPYMPITTGVICFFLLILLGGQVLTIGTIFLLTGVFVYALSMARRDRIILLLAGTKIGACLFAIFILVLSGNNFHSENFVYAGFYEATDGIFIIILCIFSVASVILDVRPIGFIFRQIAKSKGDDKTHVISQMIEITDEKKEKVFKYNMLLNTSLIVASIIFIGYAYLFIIGIIKVDDQFFGLTTSSLGILSGSIFLINGLALLLNAITGIILQLELRKANK